MSANSDQLCTCGHYRKHHIYEEGACRPGFECQTKCDQFKLRPRIPKKNASRRLAAHLKAIGEQTPPQSILAKLNSNAQQPYKCPVCDGAGKVSRPPWVAGDQPTWSGDSFALYDCQACTKGILWR